MLRFPSLPHHSFKASLSFPHLLSSLFILHSWSAAFISVVFALLFLIRFADTLRLCLFPIEPGFFSPLFAYLQFDFPYPFLRHSSSLSPLQIA